MPLAVAPVPATQSEGDIAAMSKGTASFIRGVNAVWGGSLTADEVLAKVEGLESSAVAQELFTMLVNERGIKL
jgi:hypothetical protein